MISVIAIVKNDRGIEKTLSELIKIPKPEKTEIIVVDASGDNLNDIRKRFNKVRWISYHNHTQKKYTIPEQRNAGIYEARGNIIVFIDASCVPEKNWLTELVKPINKENEKIVMGRTGSIEKETLNDLSYAKLKDKKYVVEAPTINLAILKNVFDTVGFFDENLEYGSDVDLSWRAINKGFKIRYQPTAYVAHNWGNTSQEIKRSFLYGKARARLLIKHYRTHWQNLLSTDSPAILYPVLILGLPIAIFYPWYLLLFVLLFIKNIKEPNPAGIVVKHIVYGCGVLIEVKDQIFKHMLNKFKILHRLDFVYWVGLFLFGAMIYGLTLNFILPKLGIADPLSTRYIWPIYLLFTPFLYKLIRSIYEWICDSQTPLFLKLMLIINPIIAALGAYHLNNTGDGQLTMISVVLICLTFVFTLFRKGLKGETLKLSLYSSALSLVLANSLRSHYLVGWDIHQEFLVFRLTNAINFWNINTFKDAYNASLSITILPTLIHNLTGISQLTIFRFVYPLLIALIPTVVFLVGTRLVGKKIAYTGAFVFLLQAQFFSQLPAILRQGIAFIFFALLIDSLVRLDINQKYRNILILVFGTGMILSHYSTTYVALAVLLMAKIISIGINKFRLSNEKAVPLSFKVLFVIFGLTFLWNVLITDTAQGFIHTIKQVTENTGRIFSIENKSDMVKNIFYKQSDNTLAVEEYSRKSLETVKNPQDYIRYKINPVFLNTGKPMYISDPIPLYFHVFIPWVFRLSILLGIVVLVIREFRLRQSPLTISIAFSMLAVTVGVITLPYLSVNYNFERLFQQMLVLLAPISAIGFSSMFGWKKWIPVKLLISVVLLSYVVQTTGFVDRLIYENRSWMFDNSGEQYYRYYSTSGEIKSILWLEKNSYPNSSMYADRYSKLRLFAYSDKKFSYISSQINPPLINQDSYVLSGLAGTIGGVVFSEYNNQLLRFSFPEEYLLMRKNLIYSNSITKIYK